MRQKLLVCDLMTTDVFTLKQSDSFQVVRALMDWRKIRHVPVVDAQNKLLGLLTDRDLLRMMVSDLAEIDSKEIDRIYRTIKVSDIMRIHVTTVSPDLPLTHAARIMFENKYGCLPVVEDGYLVGIITEADFVKAYI